MTEVGIQQRNDNTLPEAFSARGFLKKAFQAGMLSHTYVFRGNNTDELYAEALFLAQLINCESLTAECEPCNSCMHCKWVMGNSHPTVLTVTKHTYLDEKDLAKGTKTATQIKTGQIDQLLKMLSLSSPYNRIIIFADAEPVTGERSEIQPSPAEWVSLQKDDDSYLQWKPLNRSILNASSANKMLKTLEEPPPRTLFIFLAEQEDQLLDTIVSRCQVVPFATQSFGSGLNADDENGLQTFLNQCVPGANGYNLAQQFAKQWVVERQQTEVQALEMLLGALPVLQPSQLQLFKQKALPIQQAIRQLKSKTNKEQTLNYLFLTLCA